MLRIPSDTLGWIIAKARELETRDEDSFDGEGDESDPMGALEDRGDDATREELSSWIDDLNDGQQAELVALMWLGRGDAEPEEFAELVETARASRKKATSTYLLEKPQFVEFLEAGLEALDYDVSEIEAQAQ